MLTVEKLIACGLDNAEASKVAEAVNRILLTQSPTACWYEISRDILTPQHPFALHQCLYETVYANFNRATHGPPTGMVSHGRRHHRSEYYSPNDCIRHQNLP